jgi:hypothetical protein
VEPNLTLLGASGKLTGNFFFQLLFSGIVDSRPSFFGFCGHSACEVDGYFCSKGTKIPYAPACLEERRKSGGERSFHSQKLLKKNGLHLGGEGLAYGFHEGLGDQDGVEGGCVCIYIYVSNTSAAVSSHS